MNKLILASCAAALALSSTAYAGGASQHKHSEHKPHSVAPKHDYYDRSPSHRRLTINERQRIQKRRIRHGVQDGSLTRWEARDLRHQQRHIAELKRHFKADGRLKKRERNIIHRKLDRASANIYRKKHNDYARNQRPYFKDHYDDHGPRQPRRDRS